ncbi:FAD:protein FMN transferase [Kaarinaea lacus]
MFATNTRLFLLVAVIFLSGCGPQPKVHHEQLLVFGTIVDIKLWGVKEPQARQAIDQLRNDFNYMHRAWHAWNSGATTRVNFFIANGKPFSGNPAVLPLIKRATELSRQSGGLFNPAIGQLISLWGFASDDPPRGPPPSSEAIQALLTLKPEMENITIDGVTVNSSNPAVKLNFGAFAKGYAVDRAIEYLREVGIENAVVNAGGDLRAIGQHGDRPWRVGIRHPRQEGIMASIETTRDESIFTSGDYERYFDWQGKRYGHIIDPRTGRPADGLSSVTIVADQADLADAAATALFVAGPDDWLPVARAMRIKGAMLVDTQGNVQITPGIRDRVHFTVEPLPPIRVSEALR